MGGGQREEGGGRRRSTRHKAKSQRKDASRTRYNKGQDANRRHADKRKTLATQSKHVQHHENDAAIVCFNDMFT